MLINYEKLKRYVYRKAPSTKHYCHKCCGELDYCNVEDNVFCIRCEDCGTHTLVEETNWYNAIKKVEENNNEFNKMYNEQ